jgi:hypothetical protein
MGPVRIGRAVAVLPAATTHLGIWTLDAVGSLAAPGAVEIGDTIGVAPAAVAVGVPLGRLTRGHAVTIVSTAYTASRVGFAEGLTTRPACKIRRAA